MPAAWEILNEFFYLEGGGGCGGCGGGGGAEPASCSQLLFFPAIG